MSQQIILSHHINAEIEAILHNNAHDKCFVLTDETTHRLCRPLVSDSMPGSDATDIVIGATDVNKTLDTLAGVWRAMVEGGASRRSLMVCFDLKTQTSAEMPDVYRQAIIAYEGM